MEEDRGSYNLDAIRRVFDSVSPDDLKALIPSQAAGGYAVIPVLPGHAPVRAEPNQWGSNWGPAQSDSTAIIQQLVDQVEQQVVRAMLSEPTPIAVEAPDLCPQCGASWECEHTYRGPIASQHISEAKAQIDRQITLMPHEQRHRLAQADQGNLPTAQRTLATTPHFMLACPLPLETLDLYNAIRMQMVMERAGKAIVESGNGIAQAFEPMRTFAEKLSALLQELSESWKSIGLIEEDEMFLNRAERRRQKYRPFMKEGSYNKDLWRYRYDRAGVRTATRR